MSSKYFPNRENWEGSMSDSPVSDFVFRDDDSVSIERMACVARKMVIYDAYGKFLVELAHFTADIEQKFEEFPSLLSITYHLEMPISS
jgi:hypothetical protein